MREATITLTHCNADILDPLAIGTPNWFQLAAQQSDKLLVEVTFSIEE